METGVSGSDQTHWDDVYTSKAEAEVSWFQEEPEVSLSLLELVGARPDDAIVDIGGGASRLVDCLLDKGFTRVSVLDLSAAALAAAQARLGERAKAANWIAADARSWEPPESYDIWHDRAAFHFLTDAGDQQAYVERLNRGLAVGGHAIVGTFAPDGPEKCSGLPVVRHDADSLSRLFGPGYVLVDSRRHAHKTPWGAVQKFQFSTFRRVA